LRRKDIKKNDLVLLYDNRYQKFPSKLHTRWTGSYKTLNIWNNGNLQLMEINSQLELPTRVNVERVKIFYPTSKDNPPTIPPSLEASRCYPLEKRAI
jgi:hypothetical protein